MLIRLNLSPIAWNHKPTSADISMFIKKDISNHSREITPEELMSAIERGQTFTAGILTGSKADTWQEQQLLCIDIDNGKHKKDQEGNRIFVPVPDPMTPDEACEVMKSYNIEPYFMYYTFTNNTEGKEYGIDKFRIVVVLDKPVTDPDEMKSYNLRFAKIFNDKKPGAADEDFKNLDRLISGSIQGSVFYNSGKVTSLESLNSLPMPETPKQNIINDITSEHNNSFDLRECLSFIDPDDRETWYKVGMALKHEGYSFEDWDSWASRSEKHNYNDSIRVWNSFQEDGKNRVITGAYITYLAKQGGYIPRSQRPRVISSNVILDWDSFIL